ncbi:MAG TPA: phosphoenolpyruvate--protein phosphotransferase [Candidatus Polarisedimenticolaceae bacterium]
MSVPSILRGLGVSPGVAVGRILRVERSGLPETPQPIPANAVALEIERFDAARAAARAEIARLRERVVQTLGESCASMLDAQRLMLDDPGLVRTTVRGIERGPFTAAWALREAVAGIARKFEAIEDLHFRERGGDLEEVHRRLQRLLADRPEEPDAEGEGPTIVVARELGPSDAAMLSRSHVTGIVADLGGVTSHTAILARALGIPAVTGASGASARARSGSLAVVDGDSGTVTFDPDREALRRAELGREAWISREARIAEGRDLPATTKDGVEVILRANIEFAEELPAVLRFGARGIGLYRSEFLFLERAPALPSEDEHYRTYREICEKVAPHPAVIRTLDLGGEKYFHEVLHGVESNPSLGLRAIRLCLQRPEILRPQLRGLARAAAHGDVRLLIPFVTSDGEVRELRRILAEEAAGLRGEGKPFRADLPVGVMIETPAAALTADRLAGVSDFLSLGTNDLIQYALAVDRGNSAVSYLYDPLNLGVLRMIRSVVEAARRTGLGVAVCGEMAADPATATLLLGMGLRELSMPPRAIGAVRDAIRAVDSRAAETIAAQALGEQGG